MFSYSIILGLTLEPGVRFLRIFSTSNGPSRVAKPVNVSLDGALGEKYFTSLTFLGSGGKTSTNRIYLFLAPCTKQQVSMGMFSALRIQYSSPVASSMSLSPELKK